MSTPEPSPLPESLRDAWPLTPSRDPDFRVNVWRRIGASRSAGGAWPVWARAHAAILAGVLAVAVVAGGWIGRERARAEVAADRNAIASAYVQSLDARLMRMP